MVFFHFILHQIGVRLLTKYLLTEPVATIVVMAVTVIIHYIRFDFVDSVRKYCARLP